MRRLGVSKMSTKRSGARAGGRLCACRPAQISRRSAQPERKEGGICQTVARPQTRQANVPLGASGTAPPPSGSGSELPALPAPAAVITRRPVSHGGGFYRAGPSARFWGQQGPHTCRPAQWLR